MTITIPITIPSSSSLYNPHQPNTSVFPANKTVKVSWVGFSMCAWAKTVKLLDPNGNVVTEVYKKYPSTSIQQLRLKSGSYVFSTKTGGGIYKLEITTSGNNAKYLTQLETIFIGATPYANTFLVVTEDDIRIDRDYNDCSILISWTNRQG